MTAFDKDNQPYSGDNLDRYIERVLRVRHPGPDHYLRRLYPITRRLFDPVVERAENIPDKPCLFIGNHALFALDGMVIIPLMLNEFERFLRPMGDKFLWRSQTESMLLSGGAVIGNPKVCSALMEHEQDILVFPGGAHEAVKPISQAYTLQWRERYGFVRLAAQHGYTIVPFGMVGPEEFFGHYIEGEDIPNSALGKLLKRAGLLTDDTRPDMLPPIPSGLFGSLLPKPQRCFLSFGQPVDLSKYRGKAPTQSTLTKLRGTVAERIEGEISQLLLTREQRRGEEGMLRRLLTL